MEMEKELTEKQLETLFLSHAITEGIKDSDEWESLDDVLNEAFASGALDGPDYIRSVMELAKFGLMDASFYNADDAVNLDRDDIRTIDLKRADLDKVDTEQLLAGHLYDLRGLTNKGEKYLKEHEHLPKHKIIAVLNKMIDAFEKVNNWKGLKLVKLILESALLVVELV